MSAVTRTVLATVPGNEVLEEERISVRLYLYQGGGKKKFLRNTHALHDAFLFCSRQEIVH